MPAVKAGACIVCEPGALIFEEPVLGMKGVVALLLARRQDPATGQVFCRGKGRARDAAVEYRIALEAQLACFGRELRADDVGRNPAWMVFRTGRSRRFGGCEARERAEQQTAHDDQDRRRQLQVRVARTDRSKSNHEYPSSPTCEHLPMSSARQPELPLSFSSTHCLRSPNV